MKTSFLFSLVCILSVQMTFSQSLQVVDLETKDPVPFYHVYDPAKTSILMGGPDGKVLIEDIALLKADSVYISHLGYESVKLATGELSQKNADIKIELVPLTYELDEVEAQIVDEEKLFRSFQTALKNKLVKREWVVRTHTLEFVSGDKFLTEEYSLMGFGGLIDRKRSQGKENQYSNYFWITEYSRRDHDKNLGRVWYTTNKQILGMVLNDLLLELQTLKPKQVQAIESGSSKGKYSVIFRIAELNMELILSENADLLKMSWKGPREHYLLRSENIVIESAKIRFFENNELLVPISMDIKFTREATGLDHRFLMLASFITSELDYSALLPEDYPIQGFYNLMGGITGFDVYNSKSTFFSGAKARFETQKMEAFGGISGEKDRDWVDLSFEEYLASRTELTPENLAMLNERYAFKLRFIEYLRSQGLAW
ncbi:hypothetical protein [Algoriphagus namhaensis]